jgi:hypothetical protein
MRDSSDLSGQKRSHEGSLPDASEKFQRVTVSAEPPCTELRVVLAKVTTGLKLRDKWLSYNGGDDASQAADTIPVDDLFSKPIPPTCDHGLLTSMVDGVMVVEQPGLDSENSRLYAVPSFGEFVADYDQVSRVATAADVQCNTFHNDHSKSAAARDCLLWSRSEPFVQALGPPRGKVPHPHAAQR